MRTAEGAIATFDVAAAGTGVYQGTKPSSMNASGAITGYYFDSGGALHGFVRSAQSSLTTSDVPEAGTRSGQGTIPMSIDAAGRIAGRYVVANHVSHGFVRPADGAIVKFDAPGAGTGDGRAPAPIPSTKREASRVITGTPAVCSTASCAPPIAPSPPSALRAQGRPRDWGP